MRVKYINVYTLLRAYLPYDKNELNDGCFCLLGKWQAYGALLGTRWTQSEYGMVIDVDPPSLHGKRYKHCGWLTSYSGSGTFPNDRIPASLIQSIYFPGIEGPRKTNFTSKWVLEIIDSEKNGSIYCRPLWGLINQFPLPSSLDVLLVTFRVFLTWKVLGDSISLEVSKFHFFLPCLFWLSDFYSVFFLKG